MNESDDSFVPNPALGGFFGIGILAAAVKNLPSGLFLGFGAAVSAIMLGSLVPVLGQRLSPRYLAPVSLSISTAFAIAYGLVIETLFPLFSVELWIYIPLLAVNPLCLHAMRQGSNRSIHPVEGSFTSAATARGAAGYLFVACLLGALREAIGMGMITLPKADSVGWTVTLSDRPLLRIVSTPAGGFIILGFLAALYRFALRARGKRIP